MSFNEVVKEVQNFSGAQVEALMKILDEQHSAQLEREFASRHAGNVYEMIEIDVPVGTPPLAEFLIEEDK
jgi:hypothetical protein